MSWAAGAKNGGRKGVCEVFSGGILLGKARGLILEVLADAGGWRKCLDLWGFRIGRADVGGRESLVAQALISAAYRAN